MLHLEEQRFPTVGLDECIDLRLGIHTHSAESVHADRRSAPPDAFLTEDDWPTVVHLDEHRHPKNAGASSTSAITENTMSKPRLSHSRQPLKRGRSTFTSDRPTTTDLHAGPGSVYQP